MVLDGFYLHIGRQRDDEITACKLIGLGVQDLAAAEITLDLLHSRSPASAADLWVPAANGPGPHSGCSAGRPHGMSGGQEKTVKSEMNASAPARASGR